MRHVLYAREKDPARKSESPSPEIGEVVRPGGLISGSTEEDVVNARGSWVGQKDEH